MSKSTPSSSSGGIGFIGLLTIVFIALKLTGTIAWSWWWVLSPVLACASLAIGIIAIYTVVSVRAENRRINRINGKRP